MTGYILLDTPNRAQPQGAYPRRGGAKLSGTIIVHTSEGNWRSGVDGLTNLVRTRADWGCYHQACDWEDIARYYPWEWETWQDTETNNWAVGIAAACRTSDWGNMPADIEDGYYRNLARMAADFVAYMRDVHGITVPLKRISGAQARARVPGFAAHGDSGVARSDPGANFNWSRFFKYTAQALGGIQLQSGTITTQSTPSNPVKDWFDMATEDQLRKLLREEGWAYKNPSLEKDDTYALLRATRTYVVKVSAELAGVKSIVSQLAAGQGVDIDYAKIGAEVDRSIANAGLIKAGEVLTVDVNVNGAAK